MENREERKDTMRIERSDLPTLILFNLFRREFLFTLKTIKNLSNHYDGWWILSFT